MPMKPYLPLLRRRPKTPCALLPRLRQAFPPAMPPDAAPVREADIVV